MTTDPFQQTGGELDAALLAYLDRLQQLPAAADRELDAPAPGPAVLRQISDQAPDGMLSESDHNSIELVARAFDVIFSDSNIPAEIGELIAPLQIAILKAALIDKDFFFRQDHPARRLLEMLVSAGIGWDPVRGRDDPLYRLIQRQVARLQQEFERQIALFSDLVADIESFIAAEQCATQHALRAPIATALRQEKLMRAHDRAETDVATRIESGEVAGFVEQFLETKWLPILAQAYVAQDTQPALLVSALTTMDDLIWSVKPKHSPAKRKELIDKLPAMLASLNASLNDLDWSEGDRTQFFAKLAERHASIVRTAVERSPRQQIEIAVNIAQRASERRLNKRTRERRDAPFDQFAQRVGALVPGTWFTFAGDGAAVKRRLAWISPLRSLLIFSDRQGGEPCTIAADALAQLLRDQTAQIVLLAPVVDRALHGMPSVDRDRP